MTWLVAGDELQIENRAAVRFPLQISDVSECGELLVVILDVPIGHIMNENVFGVLGTGQIIWQVERLPEFTSDRHFYEGFLTKPVGTYPDRKSVVTIGNSMGDVFDVDATSGEVLGREYRK